MADGELEYKIDADVSGFKDGLDEAQAGLQRLNLTAKDESFSRLLERARDKTVDLHGASIDLTGSMSIMRGSMGMISNLLSGNLLGALRSSTGAFSALGAGASAAGGLMAGLSKAVPIVGGLTAAFMLVKSAIDSAEESARTFTQQLKDASTFAGLFTDDLMTKTGQDYHSKRMNDIGPLERSGDKGELLNRKRSADGLRDVLGNSMIVQQEITYRSILDFGKDSQQAKISQEILEEAKASYEKQQEYVDALEAAIDRVQMDEDDRFVAQRDRNISADSARQKYAEDRAMKSGDASYFKKLAEDLEISANQKYGKWSNDKIKGNASSGISPASEDEIALRRRIDDAREKYESLSKPKDKQIDPFERQQSVSFRALDPQSDRWSRVGAFVGGNTSAQQLDYARQTAANTKGQMLTTNKMLTALERLEPATL